jgi:hypothetical protein
VPDGHRIGPWLRQCSGLQLIDDPEGEQCLILVTARLEDDSVRQRAEEPGQQRRLASPGLAFHIDDLRMTRPGGSQPVTEDAQLVLAPDEPARGAHGANRTALLRGG